MKKAREFFTPLIPLRGKVAFPGVSIVFEAGREQTLKALEKASESADRLLFIVSQKDVKQDEIGQDNLYTVGVVSRIRQISKLPGGTTRVHAEGLFRAQILDFY